MLPPPTETEILQRGEEAAALLADDAIMGRLRRLSERLTQDWRHAPTGAHDLQLQLHAQVAAIDALTAMLRKDVEDAKFLTARLDRSTKA